MFRDLLAWLRPAAPSEPASDVRHATASADALHALALAAVSGAGLTTVLQRGAELVASALGIHHVDVLGWTPDRTGLVIRASVGWKGQRISARAGVDGEGSLPHRLARAPSVVRITELGDEESPGSLPLRVRTAELTSALAAPMGEAGVLIAWGHAPFDAEAERLVGRTAELLGVAIAARRQEGALGAVDLSRPLGGVPDPLITLGPAGRVLALNEAAEALLGAPSAEVEGRRWAEVPILSGLPLIDQDEDALPEVQLQHQGRRWVLQPRITRTVLPDGTPIAQVLLRDRTALRDAEDDRDALHAQVAQARRLEAVGKLVSAVAHDFNNVLTVVLTSSSLVLRDERLSRQGRADVQAIQRAAERAVGLSRQLLDFTREHEAAPTLLQVGVVVRDLQDILDRLLDDGGKVSLELTVADEEARVLANAGHIEQIVLNLVVNARDAQPGGGRIRVEVEPVCLKAGELPEMPGGDWVRLAVEDEGVGMDLETQQRVFEPFFSAKKAGTGLGLATVKAILLETGGHVRLQSRPGAGARFEVYFPAAPLSEGVAPSAVEPLGQEVPRLGCSEIVLLVDDEAPILQATARVLRSAGYRVLCAGSTDEALQVWRENPVVDVLVTDVVMPGASGVALLKALRAHRPLLPAILVSGFADEILASESLAADVLLLDKPYLAEELLDAIREVLDTEGTLDASPQPTARVSKPKHTGLRDETTG